MILKSINQAAAEEGRKRGGGERRGCSRGAKLEGCSHSGGGGGLRPKAVWRTLKPPCHGGMKEEEGTRKSSFSPFDLFGRRRGNFFSLSRIERRKLR